jgi:hypothetical protein
VLSPMEIAREHQKGCISSENHAHWDFNRSSGTCGNVYAQRRDGIAQ